MLSKFKKAAAFALLLLTSIYLISRIRPYQHHDAGSISGPDNAQDKFSIAQHDSNVPEQKDSTSLKHPTEKPKQADDVWKPTTPSPFGDEVDNNHSVSEYVSAIMDPKDTTFNRLACPPHIGTRYEDLKMNTAGLRYFFALNLYQVESILPRLMCSIIETIQYLGPEHCTLSIVEGRSSDRTFEILNGLRPELEALGTQFHLMSSPVYPSGKGVERIKALSYLRNMALSPLLNDTPAMNGSVVVFINDIAVCQEDILELLYQHAYQNATMTCGLDWLAANNLLVFYDSWISRSMVGDTFFPILPDWDPYAFFWNDPTSKAKFSRHQPFQVYSCWNGMAVLDAGLFVNEGLRFRASMAEDSECHMGEPLLLAKDMWRKGLARIQVVPTVNVGYKNKQTALIKRFLGFVGNHIDTRKGPLISQAEQIEWETKLPDKIVCMPTSNESFWVPSI